MNLQVTLIFGIEPLTYKFIVYVNSCRENNINNQMKKNEKQSRYSC
jgi:hypothetical protein